ncbi:protein-export membrane protein SecF [Rhodobacterales bacterium 52_120_T64]|nr:protein-export membrane protein SecF [Rhodobacterales bacterium 52_120_T64]
MRLKMVPKETKVDFFGFSKISITLSSALVIGTIIAFFTMGLNFGIDFRGGTMLMVETPEAVEVSEYRELLREVVDGDVTVTELSDPAAALTGEENNIIMVRIEQIGDDTAVQNDLIKVVKSTLGDAFEGIVFLQTDSVGAKVSGELVQAGVLAIVLAVGAVLFYIWLRFEWQFSVGAVVALIHDVFITIGIFCVTQIEFNLTIIAAILTIVGYSLNDTVVVFDRVRENLRRYKTMELKEVLNLSINETLSRTIMTSVTTLIALLTLYFLGGDVIRGFTFAMIWGVIIGTYSSIFVASVILLRLGVKRDWEKPDNGAGTQFADIDS